LGWFNTSATTGGTRFYADSPINANVTLFARWIATPSGFILGDANGDGQVTSVDLVMIARYLTGQNVSINTLQADINNDGEITPADLTLLLRLLVGRTD
jgi:hypothetical protein